MIERESTLTTAGGSLHHLSITPDAPSVARILVIHGYGEHIGRHRHFMQWLASRNIAADGIDLRGQGRSTGRRGFVRDWTDYLTDIDTVLAELPDDAPRFLLGHSHGSLILLKYLATRRPTIRGAIFVSPYFGNGVRVPRWKILLAHTVDPVVPWLKMRTGLSAEEMSSDPAMIESSKTDPLVSRVATPRWFLRMRKVQSEIAALAPFVTCPSLVLSGSADRIIDHAAVATFIAAAPQATSKQYPVMKHELLREQGREAVFNDIFAWLLPHADARVSLSSPGTPGEAG